jgi:hypothetical protein
MELLELMQAKTQTSFMYDTGCQFRSSSSSLLTAAEVLSVLTTLEASPTVVSKLTLSVDLQEVTVGSQELAAINQTIARLRETYARNLHDCLLFELFLADMQRLRPFAHRRQSCPILRLPLHDVRLLDMLTSYVCTPQGANDIHVQLVLVRPPLSWATYLRASMLPPDDRDQSQGFAIKRLCRM